MQEADGTTGSRSVGPDRRPGPQEPRKVPEPGLAHIKQAAAGVWDDPWWTLPNLLSVIRLAGVPLFLWLLLGPKADLLALLVLVVSGATDWLDGKLARWLNQYSRVGELLDPAADRLYIIATLVAFVIRDVIPLWVVVLLLGRELVLGITLLALRRAGWPPLQVHYLGKAATFLLLYAFPLLLLADGDNPVAAVAQPIAYALTVWGAALYLLAGVLYVVQAVGLLAGDRRAGARP